MGKKTTKSPAKVTKKKAGKSTTTWETYEQVAQYVLQSVGKRFGLSDVQGKQTVRGKLSTTDWVIDAKGIQESGGAIIIIECRRHTSSRLTQEHVAAIAYRILDTGAVGGITVSPHPLQRGAAKVAKANQINHVELDPRSTRDQWVAKIKGVMTFGFADRVPISVKESLTITVKDADGNVVETRTY